MELQNHTFAPSQVLGSPLKATSLSKMVYSSVLALHLS